MSELSLALELMVYGLLGVFGVLILFYLLIVAINKVFPYKEEKEN